MKASAGQIRAAVDKPDPAVRLYLFHGPDEAGASELAERLARALGPEVERIDLDMKALREQPGRLADEAASLSLFGGARYVRLSGVEEAAGEAISLLLGAERAGNPVIAIGPGLKASGKLVKQAIAAPAALSFACYVPEGIDATRLATTVAREHGLRLTGDVPQRLAAATGGDRAILAREIEKLALYLDAAPDRPRDADGAALDAIGADLGDTELFHAIDAVLDGRVADIGAELAGLGDGIAVPLMRQLSRRLMTLAELRSDMDKGASVDDVLEKHRVFFREKASTGRALRRWNAAQIARAIQRVRETERALMHSGSAGEILAQAECTAIARAAARARG
ncbi:DNA polymerase III subunit delta [Sphingomonas psychrotolerans]|uniref:DNA-directed DNA polymerase n=1 Tax=Sphingomonas psychrotolerans TaxID=1327635 RepID=A0ABU3N8A6_9SPHN|nr:DNA polymerase III subunit delta [Sphingomonas psychrotolerans]MDT8760752.1 DNA polymerase III subunit delta [Sphingomonas psychrotolerans]